MTGFQSEEQDDEVRDENDGPGRQTNEAAVPEGNDDEPETLESVSSSSGTADVLGFDSLAAESELSGEVQLPVSPETHRPSADDARQAPDREIAELRARVAGVNLPPAGDRTAIEQPFERRENFGTGRVEIGPHPRGGPAHVSKLGDESISKPPSTSADGPGSAPTATLPLGGKPVELFRAPHVMLLVQLADIRSMYTSAMEEALDKKAPKYREIAEAEVKLGFWRQENKRRAADWRLRGP